MLQPILGSEVRCEGPSVRATGKNPSLFFSNNNNLLLVSRYVDKSTIFKVHH